MNKPDQPQDLLTFFKALSDANRLKIVGLLANQAYPVEQLAAILKLSESTVSHHLSRLAEAGLVEGRAAGYYSVYSLRIDVLEELSRRLLSRKALSALAEDVDLAAFDKKIIRDYLLEDGRLKEIPAQRKKLEVILHFVSQQFKPGERYSEKRVNELLSRYHEDFATLRRELIGYKILDRKNGEYWLISAPDASMEV
jgi:predicted transcriptional regulator